MFFVPTDDDPNQPKPEFTYDDLVAIAEFAKHAERMVALIHSRCNITPAQWAERLEPFVENIDKKSTLLDYLMFASYGVMDSYLRMNEAAQHIQKAQESMSEVFPGFEPGLEADEDERTESNDSRNASDL